jgi:hypothetical protein
VLATHLCEYRPPNIMLARVGPWEPTSPYVLRDRCKMADPVLVQIPHDLRVACVPNRVETHCSCGVVHSRWAQKTPTSVKCLCEIAAKSYPPARRVRPMGRVCTHPRTPVGTEEGTSGGSRLMQALLITCRADSRHLPLPWLPLPSKQATSTRPVCALAAGSRLAVPCAPAER